MISKVKKTLICSFLTVSALTLAMTIQLMPVKVHAEDGPKSTLQTGDSEQAIPEIKENPYASHFFPKELLEWDALKDEDAIHNRSSVPLRKRVQGEKTNQDQSLEAKVVSLAITNRNTSGTPSQGSGDKAVYNFSYWQYVDTLVAWAGSAGEGIIVPPSGDVIDSAHQNGVPVLGTVFFPPTAYGGKSEWVQQFVVKDADGNFPVADKLLLLADYYGFDGWFINQETQTDATTAKALQELLVYLQQHKKPEQDIMWYDSMLESGNISWQGALNDRNKTFFQKDAQQVADTMFLDFNWKNNPSKLDSSAKMATDLNRSPYDLFAGIDVQAQGFNTSTKPSSLLRNGQPIVSLGLYCPDWTLRDGANYDVNKYWENEEKFWVNSAGDPRDTSMEASKWQGISRYFVEKSAVTSLPFVTNFNVGNGDNFYQNGQLVKEGAYNNRSIQDIMPTYRWILENQGNQLRASIDYSTAFNGGSSIALSGSTVENGETTAKLYKSQLALTGKEKATLVYQGKATLELVLGFTDEPTKLIPLSGETQDGDWQKLQVDLSPYKGKTIDTISVKVISQETKKETKIQLGQIEIADMNEMTVSPIQNLEIVGQSIEEDLFANLRFKWTSAAENTKSYNLYQVAENGEKQLVGVSTNQAYFAAKQKRPSTNSLHYQVVPVDSLGKEHLTAAANINFTFNALKAPTADFSANKSFVKVGESIELMSQSAQSAEKLTWLIEGGTPENGEGKKIQVQFAKAGTYTIRLTASNSAGDTEKVKENYITVYDDQFKEPLVNLALGAVATEASGYTNKNESPKQALDGDLLTKWCDNAHDQPWMSVDLGKPVSIVGFKLYHAEAGGENAEWNTRDYEILVSQDNQNWSEVVHQDKNTKGITEDSIPLTEARYIKLKLNKAEQTGKVARIYDFEIWGYQKTGIEVVPNQEALSQLRSQYYQTNVNEAEYTVASFTELKAARIEAKRILEVSQSVPLGEIEAAIQRLTTAFQSLVSVQDEAYKKLAELIQVAEKIDGTLYTIESYQNLQEKLIQAKELVQQPNLTIAVLEAQYNQLQKQLTDLTLVESSPVEVAKIKLREAIKQFKEVNSALYTLESYQKLSEQISFAEEMLKDSTATLQTIQITTGKLQQLFDELVTLESADLTQALTKLQQLVNNAKELTESHYTIESYAKMTTQLELAQGILTMEEPLLSEVEGRGTALQKAIDELISTDSMLVQQMKDQLNEILEQAKKVNSSLYTMASYQGLQLAIADGEKLVSDPLSTIQGLEFAKINIQQRMDQLVTLETAEIQALHKKISAYVVLVKELKETEYTSETFKLLTNQIKATEVILLNPASSLSQLQATEKELETAVAQLIMKKEDQQQEKINQARIKLSELITTAKSYQENHYTSESYQILQQSVTTAESLLAMRKIATLGELEEAMATVTVAINNLVPIEEGNRQKVKLEIAELLRKAKLAINQEQEFTKESIQSLKGAIAKTEEIIANPDVTYSELVATKNDLEQAYTGLTPMVVEKEGDTEKEGVKPTNPVISIPTTTTPPVQQFNAPTNPSSTESQFPKTGEKTSNSIGASVGWILILIISGTTFYKIKKQEPMN
ncbi:endo-beta-N-acetylglucosaminidase [Carnobacterium gallinarum]|uniref:endo-beta-N-acetylglucosaminidase n=1 Tax=Carnobacterium gallinarum TaxID=2749 RepID=UPI000AA3B80E|nr:discoidin domain-containing protein [Carnobacterium gallinarum]